MSSKPFSIEHQKRISVNLKGKHNFNALKNETRTKFLFDLIYLYNHLTN
jgi:hypothetical protein